MQKPVLIAQHSSFLSGVDGCPKKCWQVRYDRRRHLSLLKSLTNDDKLVGLFDGEASGADLIGESEGEVVGVVVGNSH